MPIQDPPDPSDLDRELSRMLRNSSKIKEATDDANNSIMEQLANVQKWATTVEKSLASVSFDSLSKSIKKVSPALKSLASVIPDIEKLPKIFSTGAEQFDSFDTLPTTFTSLRREIAMVTPSLTSLSQAEGVYAAQLDLTLPKLKDYHIKHQDLGKDYIKLAKDGKPWKQSLTDLTNNIKVQVPLWQKIKTWTKDLFTITTTKKDYFERFKAFSKDLKELGRGNTFDKVAKFDEMSSGHKAGVAALGLSVASFGLIDDALQGLKKVLFATWDFIDTKVLPTSANFNKALGNGGKAIGQLKSQAIGAGDTMEELGLSFEQGSNAVMGLATSMNMVRLPKETLAVGLKLSEYVGLGADQAGRLVNAFQGTGASIKDLNLAMKDASKAANEFGVPINAIRRDVGENIDIVQRFGVANISQFNKSAAKVRMYGLDIKQVTAAFGKAMDTFEGTSDAAAKLNTVFGTNINSLQLMIETNPEKRMEMIRKELDAQGKSWDKLNVFEKNVITTTLGVDESTAALGLASEATRKKLMAQHKQQSALAESNREWEVGLGNLRSTLINSRKEFELMFRAISEVVAKFLGFNNATEGAYTGADMLRNIIRGITGEINNFAKNMEPNKNGFGNLSKGLSEVRDAFKDIASAARSFEDTMDSLQIFDNSKAKSLVTQFENLKGQDNMAGSVRQRAFLENFEGNSDSKDLFFKKMKRAGVSHEETESSLNVMRSQAQLPLVPTGANAPDYLVAPIQIQVMMPNGDVLAKAASEAQIKMAAK